ncbi:TPA: hypothetical protein MFA42_001188 [Klebsiella pneumoniae]|nr:hypothetical protein [Klebsiella pneumoniae]HBQ1067779.1 hypothetical protein [Klebsiella pneumoniae]HBV3763754.1 hypothetical protein [Klebsiella pneumoniae]HBV5365312.1 hypothetical protein [Klebsiella pneumoniae]HBW4749352.1 hypothetical protein [Klebsiella pneumoniae]
MQITSAAKNYLYRRITTVGLYNEAAALPFARRKFRIFPGFTDKKKPLANKMERISCPINTGTHKGNRQITRTDQPGNNRSVEYIQLLEYHAVPLLVLYALFFTMIYR